MKVEILYPEIATLNGNQGNIQYLQCCLPDMELIETGLNDEPAFNKQDDIALIYMGTLSERSQEIAIQKLKPYKDKLQELIQNGQAFLMIGNSLEILGNYIENEDGSKVEALGIFDIYAKRDILHRYNGYYLGKYQQIELIGFRSQFTMLYGDNSKNYFSTVDMGIGMNRESKLEGIKQNNFIGTYLIGPLLVLNPYFTLELLKMMGVEEPKLAFEKDVIKAYEIRLNKMKTIEKNSQL